jgi:hypothetical protein
MNCNYCLYNLKVKFNNLILSENRLININSFEVVVNIQYYSQAITASAAARIITKSIPAVKSQALIGKAIIVLPS